MLDWEHMQSIEETKQEDEYKFYDPDQEALSTELTMTVFAVGGILLFLGWNMMRSCKDKGEQNLDPRNPNSRGTYEPAGYMF